MTWLSDDAVTRLRTVADVPDLSGTRYRLVREIARGGMGVVYEAEDLELQRRVALKVLATEQASPAAAERMQREARVMARLEHPGIVPLHDAGVLADGRVFYAMKLVRGRLLNEVDAAPTEMLRLFLRVCEGVAFAHAQNVLHCDLKPSNIMIGQFGEVLVMDWGVAKSAGEAAPGGTRGFMPPEQERGEALDPAADVHALGATLRAVLSRSEDARPARIDRRLAAIIAKATAVDCVDRYADAGALALDVARYLDGEPVAAYRETAFERAGRWLERNRTLVAVVAAYLVMRTIVLLVAHR